VTTAGPAPAPSAATGTCIREALSEAADLLSASGIDQPRLDARLLLANALGKPGERFYGREDELLSADIHVKFNQLIERRAAREPVSRILGTRGFWNLELQINAASLDPRPDSETLIEAVLEHVAARDDPIRVLDLGTGTGCLLLSVLSEYPNATGLGVDISPQCTSLAARNAAANDLSARARFQTGDWTTGLHSIFDVIMCNPPYIPTSTIPTLAPEVAVHEPIRALDGGADGLDCYRLLSTELPRIMAKNSRIFMETGFDQRLTVATIMRSEGLEVVSERSDLSGHDRCLVIKRDE
jgi:release factor glutamine methyltransferase